jgi:hypothetical protein
MAAFHLITRTEEITVFWLVAEMVHLSPFVPATLAARIVATILAVTITPATVAAASAIWKIVMLRGSRSRRGLWLNILITESVHLSPCVLTTFSARIVTTNLAVTVTPTTVAAAATFGKVIGLGRLGLVIVASLVTLGSMIHITLGTIRKVT